MRRVLLSILLLITSLLPAFAQQTYVNRYDVLTGFSYLHTPSVNLDQRGFNASAGVNVTRWLALGGDFSIFTGAGTITLRSTKVAPLITPLLPPGVNPSVPFDATTYTFAAGPQFNLRKWEKLTLFARPGLGVLHERAKLKLAGSPFAPLVALIPGVTPTMTDTVAFFGGGGGFDINASKHLGLRFSADFVHVNLFSSLLHSRNAARFSIGPTWKWGELK